MEGQGEGAYTKMVCILNLIFSSNNLLQLSLWKYPSLVKVAEMTGHQGRVLHMATSPDGSSVVTAGADETLRCSLLRICI